MYLDCQSYEMNDQNNETETFEYMPHDYGFNNVSLYENTD